MPQEGPREMETVRKAGRWAEGRRRPAEGRGRGRVTKADARIQLPRAVGVGVHVGIKKHLAVSGTRED